MSNLIQRYDTLYQQIISQFENRDLTEEELNLFGTKNSYIFYKFLEEYVENKFNYTLDSFISGEGPDKFLTLDEIPNYVRFYRGTTRDFLTESGNYQLSEGHPTSWSFSPYEAKDWLKNQKNKDKNSVLLISTMGDLIKNGDLFQTYGGVFKLKSNSDSILKLEDKILV